MPELVLGPMLRYVDASSASIWVETGAPCRVTVEAGEVRAERPTFTVHGHHYALVDLHGLTGPVPYRVLLDGEPAWPLPDRPPSRIRPVTRVRRLLFGSCRTSVPHDAKHILSHGVDVLRAYGTHLPGLPEAEWPDTILLLGDQVYADEPSQEMLDFIHARRDTEPRDEIADFEEYAELYRQAWSEPEIRWLLSTVPTAMIFDDHDVRDDWNTSRTWREEIARLPWWHRRITAALGAYWVYQHLGNLSPAERAADPVYAEVTAAGGDAGKTLDEFAARADAEPAGTRWSYHRDLGGVRLIMLDTRAARALEPRRRRMIDEREWAWFERLATGGVDHLLIGSSVPVLLPSGIHDVESWNEALADGAWGRRAARAAERLRQAVDLEHWGAFRRSFEDFCTLLRAVDRGERGAAPATVLLLSGDVHYSYAAKLRGHSVHQLVCSPIRNPLSRTLRLANVVAQFGIAGLAGRLLARTARVPRPPVRWKITHGPWFSNAIAMLEIDGRSVRARWLTAGPVDETAVSELAELRLGRE